jgi:hypothetical protein
MDEIISYKMCAVKVRNAKLRNYLKGLVRCHTLNHYYMNLYCLIQTLVIAEL